MKKEYMTYYISRVILSSIFAIFIMGFNWKATLLAVVFFGFFVFYLHSGWYRIDLKNPIYPLRRDTHGELIQRKALIASVAVGLLIYLISSLVPVFIGATPPGSIALPIGVLTYFVTQFILFVRA